MKHPTLTKSDIDWLIDSMKLVFPTKEETVEKWSDVSTKLDTFIGEIKARREEQAAHAMDHGRITDRFDRVDRHLGITTAE